MFPPQPRKKGKRPPKSARTRGRRRHQDKLGLIAIILAISVVLGLGIWWIVSAATSGINPKELNFTSDMSYHATEDSIYYISEQKLSCVDYANNEKWTLELPLSGASVKASSSLVAIFSDSVVVVYSNTGEQLFTKEFYGKIANVSCGQDYVAVMNEDTSGTSKIVMLNKKGEEVTTYDFSGKFIVDFAFTSANAFYIYTIDSGAVVPVARVMSYNGDLANTGNIAIEGQLLQRVIFLKDTLYMVGTNHLMQMDYIGTKQSEKLIYGWEFADSYVDKNENTRILFIPGGEDAGQKNISNVRYVEPGGKDLFVQMPSSTIKASLGRDKFYAFTPTMIRTYNADGTATGDYEVPITAEKYEPLPSKQHALLFAQDKVYIITLP